MRELTVLTSRAKTTVQFHVDDRCTLALFSKNGICHYLNGCDELGEPGYLHETQDGEVIAPWDLYPAAYPEVTHI